MAILRVEDFTATADVLGLVKRVKYDKAAGTLSIEVTSADEAVSIIGRLAIGEVRGLTAKATPEGEAELVATAFSEDVPPIPAEEPLAAPEPKAKPSGGNGAVKPAAAVVPEPKAPAPAKAATAEPTKAPVPAKAATPEPTKAPAPAKAATAEPAKKRARHTRKKAEAHSTAKPEEPAPVPSIQQDVQQMATATPQAIVGGNGAGQPAALLPTPPEPTAPPAPEPAPATEGGLGATPPAPTNGGLDPELAGAKKIRDVVNHYWEQGITKPDDIVAQCLAIKDDVKVLARIRNVEERVRRAITVMGLAG